MAQISGQVTVTTAGTPVALGELVINGPLMVKALAANTGELYLGNDGAESVSPENGMILARSETVVFEWVGSLSSIMVDAAVNGEGAAWLALDV
jgi:hypothetical protein